MKTKHISSCRKVVEKKDQKTILLLLPDNATVVEQSSSLFTTTFLEQDIVFLPFHSFLFLCVRLTTKVMYLMTVYISYTPKGVFTVNDASFQNNKVGQLHDTLQLQLIVYGIIKITRRGALAYLHEFAANQQKRNIK